MQSTFEYYSAPENIKIENSNKFMCGDRPDGYNGICKKDNYCTHLNTCAKIQFNSRTNSSNYIPISFERNYGYRQCRNNTDLHCVNTSCNDQCIRSGITIQ